MSDKENTRSKFNALSILGWISGGLSIFYLIDEVNLIRIESKLFKWLESYYNLVEKCCNFLFGWIDFKWMKVTDIENHLFVIFLILVGIYAKPQFIHWRKSLSLFLSLVSTFYGVLYYLVFFLFFIIFIPGIYGDILASIHMLFMVSVFLFKNTNEVNPLFPSRLSMRKQILGTVIVFAVLIIINFGFLMTRN